MEQPTSLVDDFPVCSLSSVGYVPSRNRPYEDRSFHCNFDKNSFLYGVFDGHDGLEAVKYCSQLMPIEIIFGSLRQDMTDEEIKQFLQKAFLNVENGYMNTINDLLAERASYYDAPDEDTTSYEKVVKKEELEKIQTINCKISSGTSAAIALIYNNKLYVSYVGNCRVLLCETDANGVLKVIQLTTEHDFHNEDELLRLAQLGLRGDVLNQAMQSARLETTRCLGNYRVKGEYREMDGLRHASKPPIIAEPDIIGGINLNESHRFLLLMSAGLFNVIGEFVDRNDVNKFVAESVVRQFREQTSIQDISQAVINDIGKEYNKTNLIIRDDMTLIVRNFNYPMPKCKLANVPSVSFNPNVSTSIITNTQSTLTTTNSSAIQTATSTTNESTLTSSTASNLDSDSDSPAGFYDTRRLTKAYVEFDDFYHYVQLAKRAGTLPPGLDI